MNILFKWLTQFDVVPGKCGAYTYIKNERQQKKLCENKTWGKLVGTRNKKKIKKETKASAVMRNRFAKMCAKKRMSPFEGQGRGRGNAAKYVCCVLFLGPRSDTAKNQCSLRLSLLVFGVLRLCRPRQHHLNHHRCGAAQREIFINL